MAEDSFPLRGQASRVLKYIASVGASLTLGFIFIASVSWIVLATVRSLQGLGRVSRNLWSEPALLFFNVSLSAFAQFPIFSAALLFVFLLSVDGMWPHRIRKMLLIAANAMAIVSALVHSIIHGGAISFFIISALTLLSWFGTAYVIYKLGEKLSVLSRN